MGRTALAVRALPDSGLVVRLTRGRLWIGVLGALLVGIVALNVVALSLSTTSGRVAKRSEALARENSALRSQLAKRLSTDEVQNAAARLGLQVPKPGSIRYLRAGRDKAGLAARRLRSGKLDASAPATPAPPAAPPPATVPTDPATVPTDPATVQGEIGAETPAAPAPAAPEAGGGAG